MLGRKLTPGEVAILETFVIPKYLSHFGAAALELMLTGDGARVVHLGCRTGYPDRLLLERVHNCSVCGVDSSLAAIELARNKAATLRDVGLDYLVAKELPTPLPANEFSHALALHPSGARSSRAALFREMARLLYVGGQGLVALPLRGSFQEVVDLFREFALKHDAADFVTETDFAVNETPTLETLAKELEEAGFDDVDVGMNAVTLEFESGRGFIEDPVARLFILPAFQDLMRGADLRRATDYVAHAIDKYWAGRTFTTQVRIGAASARVHVKAHDDSVAVLPE